MPAEKKGFMGNPNVKEAGRQISFTKEQIQEWVKCSKDPAYFINSYVKVVSLDKGIVPFHLYPYQERIVKTVNENRFTITMLFRQSGKSTITAAYVLWYVMFNEHKTAVMLANKMATAKEIFGRVRGMYELLPDWLKPGVTTWNVTGFSLENGSRASCSATSASAVRGRSVNLLVLDEFAFLPPNMADEFIASVFPTLSSSQESKLVLISTPNGVGNAFHKIWKESEEGINNFVRIHGKWQESRSQEWYEEQCKVLGDKAKIAAELDCQFAGSAHTLIEQNVINTLVQKNPIKETHDVKIFYAPEPNKKYTMTVDVARGHGLDFSAFSIIDTTKMPFNVVCTFKNNEILPAQLALLCNQYANLYNEACVLIESNDLGESVAQTMWYDLEYGNIIWTDNNNKIRGGGRIGVRTTKSVKATGLSRLKDLIENHLIILNDFRILEELQIFVLQKAGQYGASNTKVNDDLTATLWLFGWLTKQNYFEELCTASVNATITNQFREEMEDYVPVGFRDTGKEWHEMPKLTDDERELLGWESTTGIRSY